MVAIVEVGMGGVLESGSEVVGLSWRSRVVGGGVRMVGWEGMDIVWTREEGRGFIDGWRGSW